MSFVVKQGLALSGCELTWLLERGAYRQDLLALGFRSPLANIGDEVFDIGELDLQFVSVPAYNEGIVGIAVAERQDASLCGTFFCHGFGLAVHVTAGYFHTVRLGMF